MRRRGVKPGRRVGPLLDFEFWAFCLIAFLLGAGFAGAA